MRVLVDHLVAGHLLIGGVVVARSTVGRGRRVGDVRRMLMLVVALTPERSNVNVIVDAIVAVGDALRRLFDGVVIGVGLDDYLTLLVGLTSISEHKR